MDARICDNSCHDYGSLSYSLATVVDIILPRLSGRGSISSDQISPAAAPTCSADERSAVLGGIGPVTLPTKGFVKAIQMMRDTPDHLFILLQAVEHSLFDIAVQLPRLGSFSKFESHLQCDHPWTAIAAQADAEKPGRR